MSLQSTLLELAMATGEECLRTQARTWLAVFSPPHDYLPMVNGTRSPARCNIATVFTRRLTSKRLNALPMHRFLRRDDDPHNSHRRTLILSSELFRMDGCRKHCQRT